jgi:hypothetical protein
MARFAKGSKGRVSTVMSQEAPPGKPVSSATCSAMFFFWLFWHQTWGDIIRYNAISLDIYIYTYIYIHMQYTYDIYIYTV